MDTQKIRVAATKKPKRTTEQLIEAAKMRDAKMDRSRKTPTKEQKAAELLEAMLNYNSVEKSAEEEADVETPKGDTLSFACIIVHKKRPKFRHTPLKDREENLS